MEAEKVLEQSGKPRRIRTDETRLYTHTRTKIRRHVKVEGAASPYGGNLVYWARRTYDSPLTGTRLGRLLKYQKGRCASCGLYLRDRDLLEIDVRRFGGREGAHLTV